MSHRSFGFRSAAPLNARVYLCCTAIVIDPMLHHQTSKQREVGFDRSSTDLGMAATSATRSRQQGA